MRKILIVEDDPGIIEMISMYLQDKEFELYKATNYAEAMDGISDFIPDLILLDWMLPDKSGIEFLKKLRLNSLYQDTPVLMLTAKIEEEDIVKGLDAGADDYITKPFSLKELLARIEAHLRRHLDKRDAQTIEFGDIVLNRTTRRIFCHGNEVSLSDTEFKLLDFFMSNPEEVHSRDRVLKEVWPKGIIVEDRSVDVYILRLRKALSQEDCAFYIQTIRNVGYRMSLTAK